MLCVEWRLSYVNVIDWKACQWYPTHPNSNGQESHSKTSRVAKITTKKEECCTTEESCDKKDRDSISV